MTRAAPHILILLLGALLLPGQGEVFYHSALEEGLAHYHEGRYEQALERLQVAGFGLLDKPATMRRVHAYTALALFELSRLPEAKASLKGMPADPLTLPLGEWGVDPADERAFRVMLRTLFPGEGTDLPPGVRRSFELMFDDALEAARKGEWESVKTGIRKLSDLVKSEPRIDFLQGMLHFASGRFNDACHDLESAKANIQQEFRDDLLFYFARACERTERYGDALAAVAAISDPRRKSMLAPVAKAIDDRRERDVARLARAFDRKDMRRLVEKFPAERGLAGEIWVQAVRGTQATIASREELIFDLARFETATDRHFFIQAAEYLARGKREKQALLLLEKSPFAADYSRDNVPFMYTMGVIRQENGDREGAVAWMRRILQVMPEYEPAQIFIAQNSHQKKENP